MWDGDSAKAVNVAVSAFHNAAARTVSVGSYEEFRRGDRRTRADRA